MSGCHSPESTSIAAGLSVWLSPLREELSRTLSDACCGAVAGSMFFLTYFEHMLELAAGDAETGRAALGARGLHTYADLATRHVRLLKYLSWREAGASAGCGTAPGPAPGMEGPEWEGEGQLFLNVLDFLLAIRHLPQPDDPAATTALGYYLSAIQAVLASGALLRLPTSLSQFMRLPVAAGILLAHAGRTQTGRPVTALYSSLPSPGTGRVGFVSFESFHIANAVAFSPELVWLSGELLPLGDAVGEVHPVPVQLWYSLEAPERGEFFLPADVAPEVVRQSPPPDFFRALHDVMSR